MNSFLDELTILEPQIRCSLLKIATSFSSVEDANKAAKKEGRIFRLKRGLKWGAVGAGGAAALAGGGYLLHRYLKKKKAEEEAAEQAFPQGF